MFLDRVKWSTKFIQRLRYEGIHELGARERVERGTGDQWIGAIYRILKRSDQIELVN